MFIFLIKRDITCVVYSVSAVISPNANANEKRSCYAAYTANIITANIVNTKLLENVVQLTIFTYIQHTHIAKTR